MAGVMVEQGGELPAKCQQGLLWAVGSSLAITICQHSCRRGCQNGLLTTMVDEASKWATTSRLTYSKESESDSRPWTSISSSTLLHSDLCNRHCILGRSMKSQISK